MVQFSGVNIEMYGEPRYSMNSMLISPAFVTSTITAPVEKSHPEANIQWVMKILNNPYMKLHLNKIKSWLYYLS